MYYVYAYCNPSKPLNNDILRFEPFYIGKGSKRRAFDHLRDARNNKSGKRLSHIRTLLSNGIEPQIVFIKENLSEKEAFELEIHLIKKYGRKDLNTGCLLNFTFGGDGAKHSPETCKKIADKLRGRKATPEFCKKVSLSLIGKPRSPEAKSTISNTLKGRPHSSERKKAISIGMAEAKIKQQKKWLITTPETSFCIRSLDYLYQEKIENLYTSFRKSRPMKRGPLRGWSLTQITTS